MFRSFWVCECSLLNVCVCVRFFRFAHIHSMRCNVSFPFLCYERSKMFLYKILSFWSTVCLFIFCAKMFFVVGFIENRKQFVSLPLFCINRKKKRSLKSGKMQKRNHFFFRSISKLSKRKFEQRETCFLHK